MATPKYSPPVALAWNRHACDALYLTYTPPTIASRMLAIMHTAMYDALTIFLEEKELATTEELRNLKENPCDYTAENRQEAYSYAAYRVLICDPLYANPLPSTFKTKVKNYFKKLGYNPNNTSEDPNTPSGIGNLAARVLLESREEDASNQKNAYADWTGYKPVNAPPPEIPICLDRWQPMINRDSKPQEFMTPHWGKVIPFALKTGSQFRPKAPIKEGGKGFKEQGDCLTEISANLTDKQKIIAEFWAGMHEDLFEHFPARDKYDHWVTPPVQCCRIGGEIVVQRQLKGVPTVIFFFVLSNALMDAGIAAWDSKSHYDYCRPSSLIWRMRDDEKFPSWGGPGRGTVQMEGEGWIDDDSGNYINNPPFAEYVSGHSTFSHAKAEIVNCFFGDNSCESSVCIPAGGSKIEGKCDPPLPLKEVVLSWKTVDEMAAQAGMSRQYGGIHFEQGDHEGRELGRKVARCVWDIACEYLNGKVPK